MNEQTYRTRLVSLRREINKMIDEELAFVDEEELRRQKVSTSSLVGPSTPILNATKIEQERD